MTLAAYIKTMPGEAGSTHAQVDAWLMETVTRWKDMPWIDFWLLMDKHSLTKAQLTTTAANGGATGRAAQLFLDTWNAGLALFSSDSRVRALVNAAQVPAGLKTDLVEASTEATITRWEDAGMPAMDQASRLVHIARART